MPPSAPSRAVLIALVSGVAIVFVVVAAVGWAMLGSDGRGREAVDYRPVYLPDARAASGSSTRADAGSSSKAWTEADVVEAASATVKVELRGVPEGAQIFLDGVRVPSSDLPLVMKKGSPLSRLRVVLQGHEPFQRWINPTADQVIDVALRPEVASEPVDAGGETKVRPVKVRPTKPPTTSTKSPDYRPPYID